MDPNALRALEDSYVLGPWAIGAIVFLALLALGLLLSGRAPSVGSIRLFVNILDSRGGNILVYLGLTLVFFSAAMRIFYHALALIAAKELDTQNAVMMLALQFITGSCFGGAFSALLKTSTGTDNARATDRAPNGPPAGASPAPPANGSGGTSSGTPANGAAPEHSPPAPAAVLPTSAIPASWGGRGRAA